MMKDLGANSYRFSISWPRVIPLGGKDDPVNEKGLQFYSDVIDECLRLGLTPFVVSLVWRPRSDRSTTSLTPDPLPLGPPPRAVQALRRVDEQGARHRGL
jgi:hypothetical protein